MSESFSDRLARVRDQIARAALKSRRKPSAVSLMAVTKTVPWERVRPAVEAGIRHIGENRVQEALGKFEPVRSALSNAPQFHLIGPLQSNKAKKAVAFFDVIQSLDRLDLAKDIERHAQAAGKKQACLIEVKISAEPTKSGIDPKELPRFLGALAPFRYLEVQGLMGIPPLSATGEAARGYFVRLRALFDRALTQAPNPEVFKTLSMGMSSDFEVAIEEGSTLVRLGTILFGAR